MRVVPVAEGPAVVTPRREILPAIRQQLLGELVVVASRVEQAGDGGGRDGRPGPTPLDAVLHPPFGGGAFLDVLDRPVDEFLGDGNSGIPAGAQSLHLGDAGRALVEVSPILGRDIAPTPGGGLRLATEIDGPGQHPPQLLAPLGVFLFAKHLRQEQHREAVPVHVVVVVLVSDESRGIVDPLRLGEFEQVVDGEADVFGVLAAQGGRAFTEQRIPGEGRHGDAILRLVGLPVALAALFADQPVEAAGDRRLDLRFDAARGGVDGEEQPGDQQHRNSHRSRSRHPNSPGRQSSPAVCSTQSLPTQRIDPLGSGKDTTAAGRGERRKQTGGKGKGKQRGALGLVANRELRWCA